MTIMNAVFENYKIPILLAGISIFAIVLSLLLLVKSTQTVTPIQFSSDTPASGSALGASTIAVDIEGAVARPGLYTLPAGSRVEDAIGAAGGLTSDVDEKLFTKTVNRAAKMTDGAKLYIPGGEKDQTSHNISFVSINYASVSELDALPGVGPQTAQKIIDNRPYQSLDELVSKKAISPSLYEKLKNNLSL